MVTDPYDTGILDSNLEEYFKIVHEAGGLVAIDQANALLCRLRIGDGGADLCHFNLHKSFSIPHGSTGPGSAAIGANKELSRFLPIPAVVFDGHKHLLDYDNHSALGSSGNSTGSSRMS